MSERMLHEGSTKQIVTAATEAALAHLLHEGEPPRDGPSAGDVRPAACPGIHYRAPGILYQAVDEALRGFPAALDAGGTIPPQVRRVFTRLGEAHARDGHEVESLQGALSVAAQVTARQLTEHALQRDFTITRDDAGRLISLGLAYIERLRRTTAAGYATETIPAGSDQSRRKLLDLLLSRRHEPAGPARHEELERLAARAGWEPPRSIAVVALSPAPPSVSPPGFLPPDVLSISHLDVPYLLFPDPSGPGRRAILAQIVGDRPAVVGPTVTPIHAAVSMRLARRGLDRLPATLLTRGSPVYVAEHLPAMLLVNSPDLTRCLADQWLAPLDTLRPTQRDRLAETLLAYFECGFNAATTAARLHTHPQTIRNRVRQLNQLFGPDLYDPAHALDYLMALHAWQLQTGRAPTPTSPPRSPPADQRSSALEQGSPPGRRRVNRGTLAQQWHQNKARSPTDC
ncbi:PucR family transcriptional regulator [Actinomadura sp. 6N118]|uniref:PucR family transcriptional regulator n=1 Tax=Actinomadura sp. 6N118 TaxID=3375151 RepID=UPI0037B66D18